jgi:hypothetical protein
MCSIKLIALFAIIACAVAEPPRRRLNFRTSARQEAADNGGEADEPAAAGYKYEAPAEAQRLRLPTRFRSFARQEEQTTNGGYNYPKPTETYGPPPEEAEPTTEPSGEYGPPEATENPQGETTTDGGDDYVDAATTEPQSETLKSLKASQYRRKGAKIQARPQKLQRNQKLRTQPAHIQQAQPIFYVDYPTADLVQPQYVYVF